MDCSSCAPGYELTPVTRDGPFILGDGTVAAAPGLQMVCRLQTVLSEDVVLAENTASPDWSGYLRNDMSLTCQEHADSWSGYMMLMDPPDASPCTQPVAESVNSNDQYAQWWQFHLNMLVHCPATCAKKLQGPAYSPCRCPGGTAAQAELCEVARVDCSACDDGWELTPWNAGQSTCTPPSNGTWDCISSTGFWTVEGDCIWDIDTITADAVPDDPSMPNGPGAPGFEPAITVASGQVLILQGSAGNVEDGGQWVISGEKWLQMFRVEGTGVLMARNLHFRDGIAQPNAGQQANAFGGGFAYLLAIERTDCECPELYGCDPTRWWCKDMPILDVSGSTIADCQGSVRLPRVLHATPVLAHNVPFFR